MNLLNSTTFDRVISNRSILQPLTLEMENYGSSRIVVLGKFFAFVRWKGKIYRQPFFVTTANTSPNLLSRDACYTLRVVKPCYTVEAERSNLQADLQDVADLQEESTQKMCDGSMMQSTRQPTADLQHRSNCTVVRQETET